MTIPGENERVLSGDEAIINRPETSIKFISGDWTRPLSPQAHTSDLPNRNFSTSYESPIPNQSPERDEQENE